MSKTVKLNKGYGKFCSNYCVVHSKYRIEKVKETCLKKYGVDSYSKTEKFKSAFKQTCVSRYGGTPFQKTSTIY